jgi:hypothetical protein
MRYSTPGDHEYTIKIEGKRIELNDEIISQLKIYQIMILTRSSTFPSEMGQMALQSMSIVSPSVPSLNNNLIP